MLPFVRKYANVVMADLRREFGIDLLDFWRGQLSFFELMVYLGGLPSESRTVRLMRDLPEEAEGWTLTDILLGNLLDTVRNMFAEEGKPVESVIPRALFDEPAKPAELQPVSALAGLFGSPERFAEQHGS